MFTIARSIGFQPGGPRLFVSKRGTRINPNSWRVVIKESQNPSNCPDTQDWSEVRSQFNDDHLFRMSRETVLASRRFKLVLADFGHVRNPVAIPPREECFILGG